jgi:hypothetical protein
MSATLDEIRIKATATASWPEGKEPVAEPMVVEPETEQDVKSSEESEA